MRWSPVVLAVFVLVAQSIAGEPKSSVPTRPVVSGTVVGTNGEIDYSGIVEIHKTGDDGVFRCEYGGLGRGEDAISIIFRHPSYAPTYLRRAKEETGPHTVRLDPGVELKGRVISKSQYTRHLRGKTVGLAMWSAEFGQVCGVQTRIRSDDGDFSFFLPTEYYEYNYELGVGTESEKFKLRKNQPLPTLIVECLMTMTFTPVEAAISGAELKRR